MKCSKMSEGFVRTMGLVCIDILEDKSTNTMKECIGMLKSQLEMLEQMEEIPS